MNDLAKPAATPVPAPIHADDDVFRALLEQSLAGVYIIQDGAFRYANARLLEIFACAPEDMGSFDAFMAWAVAEEDHAKVRDNIRKRLDGEVRSLRYGIHGRRKDGTPIYVEVHGSRAEYDGRPAIVGIVLDITERRRMEAALRENEARYRLLFNGGNDAILVHEITREGVPGRFIEVNDLACRRLGYSRDELLARSPADIDGPVTAAAARAVADQFATTGHALYERVHVTRDGREIPVEINAHLFELDGRQVALSIARDITERKLAEAALRDSEAKLREITSELGDGIYVLDRNGKLSFMNSAAEQMLGWGEAELLGRNAHETFHYQRPDGTHVPMCDCPVYRSIGSGETYRILEDWFTRKDGTMFPVSFVATPLHRGREIIGSVAAFQDITERKQAEDLIRHMAHHDTLTGLPNRTLLADRIGRALVQARRNQRRVAVLFLDLDGFKKVNDTLGHDTGDVLLKAVASRLTGCVRESDTVARMGGDEFVMVLTEIQSPDDAETVAGKVIVAVNEPVPIGGEDIHVGVSVGIALYPGDGEDTGTLMKHADAAMYRAKESGRNAYRRHGVD